MLQGRQQHAEHGGPAMVLDLQQILAGLAARCREPEQQRLVDRLAGGRIAQPPQGGRARLGGGSLPVSAAATAAACGPLTRSTPTGARPGAVAGA